MNWPQTPPSVYLLRNRVPRRALQTDRAWVGICLVFVAVTLLLGGSPRPEVATLPLLYGAAVFFAAIGLKGLDPLRTNSTSLVFLLAATFLVAIPVVHLLPLPPGVATRLGGREILTQIDLVTGLERVWRPLTLSPLGTATSLFAASVPLGALIVSMRVPKASHGQIAQGLLVLGIMSLFLGLGQILAQENEWLYLYETTNRKVPVGLFANRNHYAVFLSCLIVLAPIAVTPPNISNSFSRKPRNEWIASLLLLIICTWTAGMALLTGSRSGIFTTSVALVSVPLIVSTQNRVALRPKLVSTQFGGMARIATLSVFLLSIIPLAYWIDRAPALDRLFGSKLDESMRFEVAPQLIKLSLLYWPWGSGVGSFEKVYQVHEPNEILSPYYMNHAHNDFLEVLMTTGIAGIMIILCAVTFWVSLTFRVFVIDQSDLLQPIRKAGLIIIGLLSTASLSDYPLRTPSLAVIYAIAWIWATLPRRSSYDRRSI